MHGTQDEIRRSARSCRWRTVWFVVLLGDEPDAAGAATTRIT